jgi:CRP-like cAMP-binding protein
MRSIIPGGKMALQLTKQMQHELNQYREFVNQFGDLDAESRYRNWLNTPQATIEILRDPWKGDWDKKQ